MEDKIKKALEISKLEKVDLDSLLGAKMQSWNECGTDFVGMFGDIVDTWNKSTDKKSVEGMFFIFTGIEFEEFLDELLKEYDIPETENSSSMNVMNNVQLWELAIQGGIEKLSIFENQDGQQIMWTGNSFSGCESKDTGIMSLNDKWSFKSKI